MPLFFDLRVVFDMHGELDYANAVVLREDEDTNESYAKRTKFFLMACILGLLEEEEI